MRVCDVAPLVPQFSPKIQREEAGRLPITPHLVHLLHDNRTQKAVLGLLLANLHDFQEFVFLLVPHGSRYLDDIAYLAREAAQNPALLDIIKMAYQENLATAIHADTVKDVVDGYGPKAVKRTDRACWNAFLEKCARRPALQFVIDLARAEGLPIPEGIEQHYPQNSTPACALRPAL